MALYLVLFVLYLFAGLPILGWLLLLRSSTAPGWLRFVYTWLFWLPLFAKLCLKKTLD